MKTATFHRYHEGESSKQEVVVLPDHVTITGNEDHFALAYHDARMIMAGLRLADAEGARWRLLSITDTN